MLSITSYLISLVHVAQRYMPMLAAKRSLQKYSQWIPQKLVNVYNSLYMMCDQIYLGDIPRLAPSSIDRVSVGGSYFGIDGTGLAGCPTC